LINPLLALRKTQCGRENQGLEKRGHIPIGAIHESPLHDKYVPSDCRPVGATGRSPLHRIVTMISVVTNLKMIQKIKHREVKA
jgi:hypothetical protein